MPDAPSARGAAAGWHFGRVLLRSLWRVQVVGVGRVPRDEPVVLVSNHLGFLDGPLVFSVGPRPAHFMVKRELFTGVLGRVLQAVAQIPVDRTTGDREALGSALAVLRRGGAVGVFPEGTRGRGDVASVQQGATWLALQSGARVVPVACLGTRRTGRGTGTLPPLRSRVVVVFGEPFRLQPPAGVPGRERLRLATEQLRGQLADHVAKVSVTTGIGLPDEAPLSMRDNG